MKSEVRSWYACHYKVRHADKCDGQSGYGMTKVDNIMDQIIRYQLAKIRMASGSRIVTEQHEKAIELARARYKVACAQLSEKQRELADYQSETIRVIRGESKLSAELLNELIAKTNSDIDALHTAAEAAKQELDSRTESAALEQQEFEKLQRWADLYENCSFSAKKMLVAQFIKAVYVYRDYQIEVEFNVSFDEFRDLSASCVDHGNERSSVYPEETEKSRPVK